MSATLDDVYRDLQSANDKIKSIDTEKFTEEQKKNLVATATLVHHAENLSFELSNSMDVTG